MSKRLLPPTKYERSDCHSEKSVLPKQSSFVKTLFIGLFHFTLYFTVGEGIIHAVPSFELNCVNDLITVEFKFTALFKNTNEFLDLGLF